MRPWEQYPGFAIISGMKTGKKNIVIAGGGFGGISASLLLHKAFRKSKTLRNQYRIVLINNHHSHLYTPALYEIAAIPQGDRTLQYVKSSIAIPLADIFHGKNVKWIERTITKIDREKKELLFDNTETISFEYLVLALGAETSYFDIPGLKEHSLPLKTFADAVKLRDTVQTAIESNPKEISVIIGGAGATGVEVAAEFENFICVLRDRYRKEKVCDTRVTLLEGSPEILPGFEPWLIREAKKRLTSLGVITKTSTIISGVDEKYVIVNDGTKIPYTVFLWAGGVKAASVLASAGFNLSSKGGALVNEFLEVEQKTYAIGDNAAFMDPGTKRNLPWNVPIAEAEARIAVKNILRDIESRPKKAFKPYKKYPFILAVGQKFAIADLVLIRASGILAWILKQLVELRYLLFILPLWQALPTWWKFITVSRSNDMEVNEVTEGADPSVQ